MEVLAPETLLGERMGWVLKSDYGCEGAEVVVGAEVDDGLWAAAVRQAVPQRWIAQERFCPCRDQDGAAVNYGVYLIEGKAAGLFCRSRPRRRIGGRLAAPVLVARPPENVRSASDIVAGMRRFEVPLSARCT